MGGWIMKGIKKLLGLGLALTLSLGMVACSSSGKDKEEVGDKLQQIWILMDY